MIDLFAASQNDRIYFRRVIRIHIVVVVIVVIVLSD
jgi:hypothetical protein